MGRKRLNDTNRCSSCLLNKMWCYCDSLSMINIKTSVFPVVHYREQFLTSNTAHLITSTIKDTEIHIYDRHKNIDNFQLLESLKPPTYLLFPDDSSIPVENLETTSVINIIIPDGSWVQARKMTRKHPWLLKLPRISIKPDEESRYFLRKQGRELGVSTYEALSYALRYLEGDSVFQHMRNQFEIAMAAIHRSRNGVSERDRQWQPQSKMK
ncbi:MAG: DTW domain-containing protein [Deltaproteobacteria bacterium]|nr:DTW domain-containing protein [Deltaproteobacteria bacterium]